MRETGVEDATRRTRLANERTYLAWWRTGLTALAVGIGVGKLLPQHSSAAHWPFEVVGVGFALLGLVILVVGLQRTRAVESALDRGGFAPMSGPLIVLLAGAGFVLGLGAIALVIFG
jgi:putative membrane protein